MGDKYFGREKYGPQAKAPQTSPVGRRRAYDPQQQVIVPNTVPLPIGNDSPTIPPIVPRPVRRESGPHRTDTFRPVAEPVPFGYGQMEIGAQVWYDSGSLSDGSRVLLYVFGWGTIGGFPDLSQILIDDHPPGYWGLTNGVDYNLYAGTASPSVDPLLSVAAGSRAKAFPYLACGVFRFKNPAVTRQAPNVYRMRALVNQLTYRDPRLDATLVNRYANAQANVALVLADLLHSPIRTINGQQMTYGKAVPDAQGDWSGSYITAANDCDVALASGAKRFVFADCFREGKDVDDWIDYIRAHAQLNVTLVNGQYQIWMDKAIAASGIVFSDAANIISAGPLQVTTADDSPTRVSATFVNPDAAYKDDVTPFDDDPGVAGGTVDIIPKVYEFGCIPADQARRLVRYLRKKSALDKRLPITVTMEGAQAMPGTRLVVTSQQAGWSAIDALISAWGTSANPQMPSAWEGVAELYDAAVYDDSQLTLSSLAPPAVTSPYDTPPDVTGLTLAEEIYKDQTGVTRSRIRVSWTIPSGYAHYWKTRISFTRTGFASVQQGEFDAGPIYIESTLDILQYTVTAQTVSSARVLASGVSQNLTTAGKTTPPSDVPSLYASKRGDDVLITWQAPNDPDVGQYEVRRGMTTDTWSTATFVAKVGSTTTSVLDKPSTSVGLPSSAWRYFIKAIDASKNFSTNAATADIVVFYVGPAPTETNGYGPHYQIEVGNVCDLIDLTDGIVECVDTKSAGATYRTMLCRRISPSTIDSEISSHGYTSLQQWEDNLDAPRRLNQPLWAPLDTVPVAIESAGMLITYGGTSKRNLERRARLVSPVRVGREGADIVTRCEPVLISGIPGALIRTGPNGPDPSRLVCNVKLSTNDKFAQTMLIGKIAYTEQNVPANITIVDLTTDGSGNASYTLPAEQQLASSCTLVVDPVAINATAYKPTVTAVDNASFSISIGSSTAGVTVRCTVRDLGLGGTISNVSI